jgi:hypothetical protein
VEYYSREVRRSTSKEVRKEHIILLLDTLDLNFDRISQFEDKEKSSGTAEQLDEKEQEETIEDILMIMYHFGTKDTREIYYYEESKGIYVSDGEIVVESVQQVMKRCHLIRQNIRWT